MSAWWSALSFKARVALSLYFLALVLIVAGFVFNAPLVRHVGLIVFVFISSFIYSALAFMEEEDYL